MNIAFDLNGKPASLEIEPRETLAEVLRGRCRMTGVKISCEAQVCGSCTVLVNDLPVSACTFLAYEARGKRVTTIEGLAAHKALHPMQAAFVEHDGFQCGYCTPGQICSAVGMMKEFNDGLPSAVTSDVAATVMDFSDEEIKERMSGNLCRCGAYVGICAAIREAFESGGMR